MAQAQNQISVAEHPLLYARAFAARLERPLAEAPVPAWLVELLREGADLPLQRSEELRVAIREMLRSGGYRPTGRGKPSSEYLLRAAADGTLASINLAVDLCNAISLKSGIPISVVDRARLEPPLRIALGAEGDSYVFNASGQTIELEGLLCLCDRSGPCANAVKDSQRSKTSPLTQEIVAVLWGSLQHREETDQALRCYLDLQQKLGATTETLL